MWKIIRGWDEKTEEHTIRTPYVIWKILKNHKEKPEGQTHLQVLGCSPNPRLSLLLSYFIYLKEKFTIINKTQTHTLITWDVGGSGSRTRLNSLIWRIVIGFRFGLYYASTWVCIMGVGANAACNNSKKLSIAGAIRKWNFVWQMVTSWKICLSHLKSNIF